MYMYIYIYIYHSIQYCIISNELIISHDVMLSYRIISMLQEPLQAPREVSGIAGEGVIEIKTLN